MIAKFGTIIEGTLILVSPIYGAGYVNAAIIVALNPCIAS